MTQKRRDIDLDGLKMTQNEAQKSKHEKNLSENRPKNNQIRPTQTDNLIDKNLIDKIGLYFIRTFVYVISAAAFVGSSRQCN